MKIEKISGDKIMVKVTASDLVKLDIDIKDLYPDSKELHSFLFHIMETVREETGFNPYTGQVVVEATPASDGITIVVSKLKTAQPYIKREGVKRDLNVRAKLKRQPISRIFYFESFDDLCAALIELSDGELMKVSLYRLGNTYCCAVLNDGSMQRCISVFSEFSVKKSSYPLQLTYIREHGRLVAEGDALVNMARGLRDLT